MALNHCERRTCPKSPCSKRLRAGSNPSPRCKASALTNGTQDWLIFQVNESTIRRTLSLLRMLFICVTCFSFVQNISCAVSYFLTWWAHLDSPSYGVVSSSVVWCGIFHLFIQSVTPIIYIAPYHFSCSKALLATSAEITFLKYVKTDTRNP